MLGIFFLEDGSALSWSFGTPSLLLWVFNFFVLLFCFVKLFVYGDPIIPSKSKESQAFWRYRNQADVYLAKVSIYFCFLIVLLKFA